MKLNKLLEGVDLITIKGNKYTEVNNIFYDSKQLRPGGVFFAVKGNKVNGLEFVDEAVERGAVCVISEDDFITYKDVCKVIVKDVRKACASVANNFYNRPSEKINVVGITGTNGKTTTLYLIEAILRQAGKRCGMIGTISYNVAERTIPAGNTTPSAIMIQMLLNDMVNANIPYCAMEVSSHSLHQNRVDAIAYKRAIFTNLSSEHMDYHKDMEEYFAMKQKLFQMLKEDNMAMVNIDDDYGKRILKTVKARVLSYGIERPAEVMAEEIRSSIQGLSFKVKAPGGNLNLKTRLIGKHNIYNILAAVSFAISEGIGLDDIERALKDFKGVPGRLQKIDKGQSFGVFVDYAHTDDALRNVLTALRALARGRIIVVFGCGGDRDKAKRPRMGKVAAELADFSIITSDNPRTEDPKLIVEDIIKGLPKGSKDFRILLDRKKAIECALKMAKEKDIVLIAGKGHEAYQVFKDTVVDFDDCKIAEEVLEGNKG